MFGWLEVRSGSFAEKCAVIIPVGHHESARRRRRRKNGPSNVFLQNRRPQFVETKKLKDPLAVEVEYAQIVGFMKIVFDHLKMPAVARLGERERDLEGDKLANSPGFKRVEEIRVVQGFVRREDQQGPARGE